MKSGSNAAMCRYRSVPGLQHTTETMIHDFDELLGDRILTILPNSVSSGQYVGTVTIKQTDPSGSDHAEEARHISERRFVITPQKCYKIT
jgi:hypothetical protein